MVSRPGRLLKERDFLTTCTQTQFAPSLPKRPVASPRNFEAHRPWTKKKRKGTMNAKTQKGIRIFHRHPCSISSSNSNSKQRSTQKLQRHTAPAHASSPPTVPQPPPPPDHHQANHQPAAMQQQCVIVAGGISTSHMRPTNGPINQYPAFLVFVSSPSSQPHHLAKVFFFMTTPNSHPRPQCP